MIGARAANVGLRLLRCHDDGIAQFAFLDRCERVSGKGLGNIQIEAGKTQFLQSRHDFGGEKARADLIYEFNEGSIMPLHDAHGKRGAGQQGRILRHRLRIGDAGNPGQEAL